MATFKGDLTALASKRLTKEKAKLEKDREELASCGIYVAWGDELRHSTALIVGPEGTPYENGFYFFDMQIPDNYPMHPPKVDFKTGDGRVRFNPNLYVEGKNEPGHETETGKNDELYNEIIRYENIAVAVVKMLKNPPAKFKAFLPQMREVFLNNFDKYIKNLESYKAKDGKQAKSPIWSFPVTYRTSALLKELEELKNSLLKEDEGGSAATASEPLKKRARKNN